MRSNPSDYSEDPDLVETLPVSALTPDDGLPISDGWDSEAPTAVHAKHPLFAGPPRLPTT